MTVEEFDTYMGLVARWKRAADELLGTSGRLEDLTLKLAGIEHVDREPGFPCWRLKDTDGCFNTPREALMQKRMGDA